MAERPKKFVNGPNSFCGHEEGTECLCRYLGKRSWLTRVTDTEYTEEENKLYYDNLAKKGIKFYV